MNQFNFKYQNKDLVVSDVPEKLDDWIIKKSEVFEYSKDEEIVKAFIKKFPTMKLLGDTFEEKFDFLTNVVSRNSKLLEWFANEKIKYAELAQLPKYLKTHVEPAEFAVLKDEVKTVNDILAEDAQIRSDLAKEYNRKLKDADNKLKTKLNEIKSNNDVLKIVTLTSQSLPLSMALSIEEFNVKTNDSEFSDKKKYYVREMLINYKIALLKLIKENPDIDLDLVLDELTLK